MTIDVESLHGPHDDDRWNRTAVGDTLERNASATPDKVVFAAAPSALRDPALGRVTDAQAEALACRLANALPAEARNAQTGSRCSVRTRSRRTSRSS